MPRILRLHAIIAVAGLVAASVAWGLAYRADWGRPTWQSRWVEDLYREKTALAAETPPPRLVIVGGSSALFGIRADVLSRKLGVHAVNFATHAGLDLEYLLHRSKRVLRNGDLLLLSLEYELYDRDPQGIDWFLLDYLLARDPDYLASLPLHRQARAALQMTWDRARKPWVEHGAPPSRGPFDLYTEPHLDGFGDTLGNNPVLKTNVARHGLESLGPTALAVHDANLDLLEAFSRWCSARGIRVIATAPPLMDDPAYRRPEARAVWDRIVAWHGAQRIPFLMPPATALYPLADFFDTRYHLDGAAAERHTEVLAELLKPFVAAAGSVSPAPHASSRLAALRDAFWGWEPRSGIGTFEQDPSPDRPGATIWALGDETTLVARPVHDGAAQVEIAARATAPGQKLQVLVNGEPRGEAQFAGITAFEPVRFLLGPIKAGDTVVLRHGASNPGPQRETLLFRRLRIDPAPSPQ